MTPAEYARLRRGDIVSCCGRALVLAGPARLNHWRVTDLTSGPIGRMVAVNWQMIMDASKRIGRVLRPEGR